MKRVFDTLSSLLGLVFLSPFFLIAIFFIWIQDYKSPFYVASRVGKDGKAFKITKLRSMVIDSDKLNIESTSTDDDRITPLGKMIRRYKIDELAQLWNVLKGDMSLVGPRPNTENGVSLYTNREKLLLSVKPGITDFASIIFSDEGEILLGHENPDDAYNKFIRPWKSRLGILYIENKTFLLDIQIILFTFLTVLCRKTGIKMVTRVLRRINCDERLLNVCQREEELYSYPPPGLSEIVTRK